MALLFAVGGIEGPNGQNQNDDKDMYYAWFLDETKSRILYVHIGLNTKQKISKYNCLNIYVAISFYIVQNRGVGGWLGAWNYLDIPVST